VNAPAKSFILIVDDNRDQLQVMERFLSISGYVVRTADSGRGALAILKESKPALILLDVMMPEMDGYHVCSLLQQDAGTAYIPVIFITALGEEQDRARAFSVGGVDYLVKPVQKKALLEKVRQHLVTNTCWQELRQETGAPEEKSTPLDFSNFKQFLRGHAGIDSHKYDQVAATPPSQVYTMARHLGISNGQMATYIADFFKLPYLDHVNPYDIKLGVLPMPFCKTNLVVPLGTEGDDYTFVLSNPFNWEVVDNLQKIMKDKPLKLAIAEPEHIELLFKSDLGTDAAATTKEASRGGGHGVEGPARQFPLKEAIENISEADIKKHPVVYIANTMINKAIVERASDIHIEPKEDETIVRFRVDGDLRDALALKKNTGVMLISRLKVLGGLDLAERRKPQDGSFAATVNNKIYKLRLATTSTPYGESLIIRLLEPSVKPKDLSELGMTDRQVKTMVEFANRTHGVIMIVGPTGSGKTTTIYSFLSQIDCQSRSLISVEDPVEYSIAYANQQQANEKAGITFESLLKSAVRQDPDILFLGEVRDPYSAKMSIDFASTGHLTVTTLHTSNATTAIFRLERLGIERGTMADTIIGVVAQRLLKKLCPQCKEIVPISAEEKRLLASFTDALPAQVAHPVGCPQCNNTGYLGREGVYEIIRFDHQIAEMARAGASIAEIRNAVRDRGDYLISSHAVEKVKRLAFAPKDVYEQVLVEELAFEEKRARKEPQPIPAAASQTAGQISILVVEDDNDSRTLVARFLENNGYRVTPAEDGVSALLQLGKQRFDLIISDVNMPNLNGFKLLEMKGQKGIDTPVIFLTALSNSDDINRGLGLGAADYITKPTKKDILMTKVKNVLGKRRQEGVTA
jgi:type II secretory ATPase GspE/PulE/Tfp pilus assembly ATPase PilB-like protein/DNA-binding response OmpR family regulator